MRLSTYQRANCHHMLAIVDKWAPIAPERCPSLIPFAECVRALMALAPVPIDELREAGLRAVHEMTGRPYTPLLSGAELESSLVAMMEGPKP